MLFGCIHIPDFAVQAAIRCERPDLFKTSPVVVLDGPKSQPKVFACNELARREGIAIGMTKAQVQVLPGVITRKRQTEEENAAQSALIDCGCALSPRVESACPGSVIADLSGTERLMGLPLSIGQEFLRLAAQCDLQGQVAIAANPDTAIYAARGFEGITIIPPGEEAARMAPLPVSVLDPDPETLESLLNWGITDFKSLAHLPTMALTQRLGQRGLELQQLARGEVQRILDPSEPSTAFRESIEPEESVELLEPLSFVLNRLLNQLLTRIRARSFALDRLEIDLELEIHSDRQLMRNSSPADVAATHRRTLKLPVPTQDAQVLLKLLQLDLAAHPPKAPVRRVMVEGFPARLRVSQGGLFEPSAPEPATLELTIARLRAVVGEHDEEGRLTVGFPIARDSHQPDSFDLVHSSAPSQEEQRTEHSGPPIALRILRPPLNVDVDVSENQPAAVTIHGNRRKVLTASGPWHQSGVWWNGTGEWIHDEWDLELDGAEKALCRVFRDCRSDEWFFVGRYD